MDDSKVIDRRVTAGEEGAKRQIAINKIRGDSFPAQLGFIDDTARFQAAQCTRRAGKTGGVAAKFAITGLKKPGRNMLFIAKTKALALKLIWKDALKTYTKKYNIPMRYKRELSAIEWGNGTMLYLLGGDSDREEMEKVLGLKYVLVDVDEAQSFTVDLETFIMEKLFPATADEQGIVSLSGSPNNNVHSFFYKVTAGLVPGWSVHKWSALQNPYVAKNFASDIEYLKATRPGIELTSGFRQNYLNEWVIDESKLVYKYQSGRNSYSKLPAGDWRHVLGVDLGYSPDPSAFVVCAYSNHDPDLYVRTAYKRIEMTISDVAAVIRRYQQTYNIERIIIDNANKQAVEELKQRHGLHLEAADKTGKVDFIQMLNDDLILGKIKIHEELGLPLADEMKALTWDERALERGKYVEMPRHPNHCCDAFLYPWRFCYNYIDHGPKPAEVRTDTDKVDRFWEEQARIGAQEAETPWWEL